MRCETRGPPFLSFTEHFFFCSFYFILYHQIKGPDEDDKVHHYHQTRMPYHYDSAFPLLFFLRANGPKAAMLTPHKNVRPTLVPIRSTIILCHDEAAGRGAEAVTMKDGRWGGEDRGETHGTTHNKALEIQRKTKPKQQLNKNKNKTKQYDLCMYHAQPLELRTQSV